jgi:uncharacterized membrane protein
MKGLKKFLITTVLGGLGVVLPLVIIVLVFYWLYGYITGFMEPLVDLFFKDIAIYGWAAEILTIIIIIVSCFLIGLLVRTSYGKLAHMIVEDEFLKKIPGYGMVNDTVRYFTDDKMTPFSQVALVKPFGNSTLMTGFVTDNHPDRSYTVFVPTGPNPTSGNIYHLERNLVTIIDISVEDAMQSIIGGGAGSSKLMKKYLKKAS